MKQPLFFIRVKLFVPDTDTLVDRFINRGGQQSGPRDIHFPGSCNELLGIINNLTCLRK